MHKIDRYGVIALLFLIVTIVTASMWEDAKEGVGDAGALAKAGGETKRAALVNQTRSAERAQQLAQQAAQQPAGPAAKGRAREGAAPTGMQLAPGGAPPVSLAANASGETRGLDRLAPESGRGGSELRRSSAQEERLAAKQVASAALDPDHIELTPDPSRRAPASGLRAEQELPRTQLAANRVTPDAAGGTSLRDFAQRASNSKAGESAQSAQRQQGSSGSTGEYVVARGDTLGSIAQRFLGSSEHSRLLASVNGISNPNLVVVGTKLNIPSLDASALQHEAGAPRAGAGATYKIQSGDTLGAIALSELGSSKLWTEIKALNPGLDEKHLLVGKTIVLPAGAAQRQAQLPASNRVADARAPKADRKHFVR